MSPTNAAEAGNHQSFSSSGVKRKLGLGHLLQGITIGSDNSIMAAAAGGTREEEVETFLDDNSDFLDDYIRRKVHKSKLEQWLFHRPDKKSREASGALVIPTPSAKSLSTSNCLNPNLLQQQHSVKRQRSRSFTPLRKLSATKFEEGGLSTPIVVTDVDGQPSFLRSNAAAGGSDGFGLAARPPHAPPSPSASLGAKKTLDRNQSLFLLLEEVLGERDIAGIVCRAARGLRGLTGCDYVSVLLTKPEQPLSGTLHIVDQEGGYSRQKGATADRLMTGVITSRQTLQVQNPDLATIAGEPIAACLTAPMTDSNSGRVSGAWHVASTDYGNKRSFTREDEGILGIMVR